MDPGIAAMVAAGISGAVTSLTTIVATRASARQQSEIIQMLAANAAISRNVAVEAISAKPSIRLRVLRAVARFLIAILRIFTIGTVIIVLGYLVYRNLPDTERGSLGNNLKAEDSAKERAPQEYSYHDRSEWRQFVPEFRTTPITLLRFWPGLVFLAAGGWAFVVSSRARRTLDRPSLPQSN